MPWKVFEEEGKFCVYKLNADDSKGDLVKCHDTEEEAAAHARALYANVEDAGKSLKHGAGGGSSGFIGGRGAWRKGLAGILARDSKTALYGFLRRTHMWASNMGFSLPTVEATGRAKSEDEEEEIKALPDSNWKEGKPSPMSEDDVRDAFWLVCAVLKVKHEVDNLPGPIPAWAMSAARAASKSLMSSEEFGGMRVKILAANKVIERNEQSEETTKRAKSFEDYQDYGMQVLGMPFGGPIEGRDAEGEAFTKNTDPWLEIGETIPVTYYHGFGPDSPDEVQDPPIRIGRAKFSGVDERGFWFETRLDPDEPLTKRLLVEGAEVKASSGAISHLTRTKPGGLIATWPVRELALFDVNEWRKPANDFAVIEWKKAPETEREDAPKAGKAKGESKQGEDGVVSKKSIQKRALQLLAKQLYEVQ